MAGTYSAYDFTETVNHYESPFNEKQVDKVLFAYGQSNEGYGEWSGGFILRLKDGRTVMLTGWCDTSGWGCQDGMNWVELGSDVDGWADEIKRQSDVLWITLPPLDEWDEDPIDLNRYLRGETGKWSV